MKILRTKKQVVHWINHRLVNNVEIFQPGELRPANPVFGKECFSLFIGPESMVLEC
jgi:hypothetical protein